MLHDPRIQAVLFWVFVLVFIAALQISAETLYCWTDPGGAVACSNIAPPTGVEDFSAVAGVSPGAQRSEAIDLADNPAPGSRADAGAVDAGSHRSMTTASLFLMERIAQREASVRHIEVLLRTHPEDATLRRRLNKKKQLLYEDRIRLGLLAN